MSPVVSIIVPVYKTEQYLPRCLDSILAQTYTDFELLLIDDGSPDSSGKICDEYARKDSRIRVFHKENGGVGSARNTGLDNAGGELICFADSDDFVNTDWLAIFLSEGDIADLTIQSFYECRESGINKIENKNAGDYSLSEFEGILLDLEEKGFGYLWCKMFKNDIIKNNDLRFNVDFTLCEDLEFVYRYLECVNSIRIKSEGAYNYRVPIEDKKKYEGRIKAECYLSIYRSAKKTVFDPNVLFYIKKRSAECAAYDIISAYLNKKYRYAYEQLLAYGIEIQSIADIRFSFFYSRLFKYFYRYNNLSFSHVIYCFVYSFIRIMKKLLKRHS